MLDSSFSLNSQSQNSLKPTSEIPFELNSSLVFLTYLLGLTHYHFLPSLCNSQVSIFPPTHSSTLCPSTLLTQHTLVLKSLPYSDSSNGSQSLCVNYKLLCSAREASCDFFFAYRGLLKFLSPHV